MNGGENVARKKYPEAVETGQRIRLARIEKGLSMEQLGGKLSPPASKGAVSNWENGYNLPNNTRLNQLSKVLDVSTTYLLNGSYTLRDMLEKQLKENFNDLVKEFVKETGEFPNQIHLVAEGHSQYQAVKFEMKKQIY